MTTSADEAPAGSWHGGWYRFAHALASPNVSARDQDIAVDLIVVHSISLPPGHYGGQQVQQLFTNTLDWDADPFFDRIRGLRVSAHFYIRRNGELWQFAGCDEKAWHAGVSHYGGRDNCNDNSIGIELEGLEGEGFESAQYESLASLVAAIAQLYPISAVAGHEHIAPGRKHDPGAGFEWTRLAHSLGWGAAFFPPGCLRD
jgi:AmpD protein